MHVSEYVKIAEIGCPEILKASFSKALCYSYEDTKQSDSMIMAWVGVQYRSSFATLEIFAFSGCYAA